MENEDAMSSVLAIIPARVGSKGIPRKNFTPLAGGAHPMGRALACAKAAKCVPVITSDHPDIEVFHAPPHQYAFYRTAPLHTDTCSMVDVVLDVLKHYPGPDDQKVLLVQPTQPLREPKHLALAVAHLDNYYSVASVVEVEPAEKLFDEDGMQVTERAVERRQDAQRTFACDGTVYCFRRGWFERGRRFMSYQETKLMLIPPSETARLDTPFDWEMAELRLRSRESSRWSPVCVECEYARCRCQATPEMRKRMLQAWREALQVIDSFGPLRGYESEYQMPLPYDEDR